MPNRTFQYRQLSKGDVFSIIHEGDSRRYKKLAPSGAVEVGTGKDCIPAPRDRCYYHYSIDTRNNIFLRSMQ